VSNGKVKLLLPAAVQKTAAVGALAFTFPAGK
jgi:hypothetical protein